MTHGVTILGSTGFIGMNSLDVISRHPDQFHVSALSAHRNVQRLFDQCCLYNPEVVSMSDPQSALQLQDLLQSKKLKTRVLSGAESLDDIATEAGDTVICGIVGAAGLSSTIAAVMAGKKVLIANKEPLVMLGQQIIQMGVKANATILPLDSEHNAIFQCLPDHCQLTDIFDNHVKDGLGVEKIILTGSGGPFRTLPLEEFCSITPEKACAHPNWEMGAKISVDSSTMMNKGLELIEACALFAVQPKCVEIVIHPQSVIHSMVQYIDGSVIAQMASPDMRVPIANALAWPRRIASGAVPLNLPDIGRFDFQLPEYARFPLLHLARETAISAGFSPAVLNAANEIAVHSFLQGDIAYNKINDVVQNTMDNIGKIDGLSDDLNLESVLHVDQQARLLSQKLINKDAVVN